MPNEMKAPQEIGAGTANRRLDPALVARKVEQLIELTEMSTELALAGIRRQHPEASVQQQHRLLAERLAIFREGKWRGGR